MKTCKRYLPVVRTLEITKIIDFNQADYTWYCVCCYFLAVNFDWSIILIRKLFGASRHISGKIGVKLAIAHFVSNLVGNPKNRFSPIAAHLIFRGG